MIASDYQMPYTWQSSIGFQTQFGTRWGFEADLTHWKGYNFARQRDPNLAFNPATGYNCRPTAATGPIRSSGRSSGSSRPARPTTPRCRAASTKRYASNWQASLTYTYMLFMNDNTTNFQYQGNNPFDPDAEWARSTDFQRHTLRLNGLWRGPWGINLSGAYFFGSGNYYATTIAANPFGAHRHQPLRHRAGHGRRRTSPDRFDGPTSFAVGDVVPRNALKGAAAAPRRLPRSPRTFRCPAA